MNTDPETEQQSIPHEIISEVLSVPILLWNFDVPPPQDFLSNTKSIFCELRTDETWEGRSFHFEYRMCLLAGLKYQGNLTVYNSNTDGRLAGEYSGPKVDEVLAGLLDRLAKESQALDERALWGEAFPARGVSQKNDGAA